MVQTTSTIYQSGVTSYGRLDLANAAAAGDEIVYVVNDIRDTFEVRNGAILSIGTGAGSGTAAFVQSCGSVYSTPNPVDSSFPDKVRIMGMTISAGAQVHVGNNDTLFVSATSNGIAEKMKNCSAPVGARGDISIAYNGDASGAVASSASLFLDDGAMLSGGGYLGGVADKGAAQTWGSNQTQSSGALQASRTGAISAGNKVKVKVDGDWAVIGDVSTVGADTVFGNDDEITIGGNIGVFMNTVLRIGDRVHISQTGQNGSGIFVGSGAKMLVGNDASIYARGGFGAGYSGKYSAAVISIGSGASITLDHQADGILAAEAGAVVTIGDGATINAAMLSAGYAQDPNNGSFVPASGAPSMQIGNNATINLMTEALFDDPTEFQIAQKGYIVLDNNAAQMTMLTFGSHANLLGSGISVGDLIKQYVIPNVPERFGSYAGKTFLWGNAAASNKLTFGAGASVNLNGGGIEVNGTSDSIVFSGGTINIIGSDGLTSAISNTISAGWISMGSSFKVLTDSNGVSTLVTYGNSGNNSITFGDDFNIDLQQNAATGATGNLTADGSKDVYSFGNNLRLNANSIYLGQFSHTYSGINYIATPTGVSITFGNNANVMLSGGFIMNSANGMFMSMGDSGNLSIASGFLFNNLAGVNGVARIGNNANIMVNSGFDFSNGGANGSLTIGNDLNLSTGNGFNFSNGGAGGTEVIGDNASIVINNGFNFGNGGDNGRLSIGNSGHIDVSSGFNFVNSGISGGLTIGNDIVLSTGSGFAFSNSLASGSVTVGSNAHMNINGGFNFNNGGSAGSVTIGDSLDLSTASGFNFNNSLASGSVIVGSSAHMNINGAFNLINGKGKGALSLGNDLDLSTASGFGFSNGTTLGSMVVGSNAHMNINGALNFSNGGDSGGLSLGNGLNLSTASGFIFSNGGLGGAELIGDNASIVISNGFDFINDSNRGGLSIGNGGHIDVGSGFNFSNGGAAGSVTIGNDIILSTGSSFNFSNGGANGALSIGNGGHINVDGGFNFSNGANGTLSIGKDIFLSTGSSFNFSNSGYSGSMVVGSNAHMNINGGFTFSNLVGDGTEVIGDNASIAISNDFNYSQGGNRGGLSIGNSGHIDVGAGFNFVHNGFRGSVTIGNDLVLSTGSGFTFSNGDNTGIMNVGSNAHMNINGGFNFNNLAYSGGLTIGDNASVAISNGFDFSNGTYSGNLNIGNSGHIDVGSGFTFSNGGSAGSVTVGNYTELNVKNDFAFTNVGASGAMTIGSGANLNIGSNFSIYNGDLGKVSFGDAATVKVGSSLNVSNAGANGAINVGSSDNISVAGSFNFVNSGSAGSINIGASTTIIADNGFGFVNSGASGAFLAQDNISIKAGGSGFTFVNSGSTGASMTVGNSANFDINGNFQYLNPGSGNSGNEPLSVGSSGIFNITSNFIVVGSSAAAIFGAYTSMVVGGNVSMLEDYSAVVSSAGYQYGSYTDLSIGSNMSICGSNIHFNADISNTISVGGSIILKGDAGVWSKGEGGTLNASGISVLGGPDSKGSAIANESFVVGANNIVTISNGGLLVDVANGQYVQGDGGTLDTLGDITIKGAGAIFSAGNDFVISTHGNGITLDSGATSFTIGNNAILDTDGGIISISSGVSTTGASANNIVIGSNASVNIGGIQYGGSTQSVAIAAQAHGNLGNIIMNGKADKLAIGNDANLNIGNITLNSGSDELTIGSGATLNMDTLSILSNGTVGIGDNAIISMADLNMKGVGAYTSIGNGATLNTGNIILDGNADSLIIGSNASINTGDITFNGANQAVSIGNGANASFGNIALLGSGAALNRQSNSLIVGSGNYFASNMTMGVGLRNSITLASGAYWSVNNLIFSGVANNSATATAPNITLQSGATLIVDNMTGIGLSPTNKVFIRASAGGNVIIHSGFFDTVSNAVSANALDVNFAGAATNPVIFEYDGDIKDTEGKLTLRGLPAITDNTKLIFNLGKDTKYTDQNRFKTVYEKGTAGNGTMIVQYMSVETGEWEEVARFSVPQWGGPTTVGTKPANILIVKQADGSYQMTITKCFLSGTHIMTENGERVVEELAVGDQIITFKDGKEVLQTIVWVGSMDVDVNDYSNKETLYPIRIKAHAFGLNQPHRDLLVTPEHTVYVDGGLTPARMLVNGRSIIVDKSIEKYTVHHIETIEHSIILSENLLTESYLNTDNKDMFNGEAVNLRLEFNENAGHKSWEEDAAAPLVVAREKVEPIWQRLDRRATQLGFATVERAKTTRDPALCLTTQKGDVIKPVDIQGKVYSFYLPANVRVIGLRSRAAQPAEAVGPFYDDRRMLGVLVSKFTVLGDEAVTVLPSEMSEVSGWYPAEKGRSDRWTKGLAILPQEVSEISNKVRLLKVELTDSSIYLLDEEGDWAKTA